MRGVIAAKASVAAGAKTAAYKRGQEAPDTTAPAAEAEAKAATARSAAAAAAAREATATAE